MEHKKGAAVFGKKFSGVREEFYQCLGSKSWVWDWLKIGGQAAATFVKQAAGLIAKEGTIQGLKSIATGLVVK